MQEYRRFLEMEELRGRTRSAHRKAPAKIGKAATIVALDADGKMRTLRTGINVFTCMRDNPATLGPDPMCMNKNVMDWIHA